MPFHQGELCLILCSWRKLCFCPVGGQVHMSWWCASSCATWAVHSFVSGTMLTQRLYPPSPPFPPSSLHPLSANSSPHITTRSSELPPTPPYFSVGIFQMDLCPTCTHLLDVSVPFLYVSASWKVYFLSNAFESNVLDICTLWSCVIRQITQI